MTPRNIIRLALGYLALVSAQLGLWALLAPSSFYSDFPDSAAAGSPRMVRSTNTSCETSARSTWHWPCC